ncbi:MAG: hypothetical protein LBI35_03725 [Burkholderiales bacterium]|nr:hypothetical protein [Burkholderiales bacterium]
MPFYLAYLLRETGNLMVPTYYLLMSTVFGLVATWALDFNKAWATQQAG